MRSDGINWEIESDAAKAFPVTTMSGSSTKKNDKTKPFFGLLIGVLQSLRSDVTCETVRWLENEMVWLAAFGRAKGTTDNRQLKPEAEAEDV